MFGKKGFYVSASGAIQDHHGPLVSSPEHNMLRVSYCGPIVSSPEHNVLRVSYCDRSMSGVRPSVHLCVRPSVPEQLLKKSSPLKPANRFQ